MVRELPARFQGLATLAPCRHVEAWPEKRPQAQPALCAPQAGERDVHGPRVGGGLPSGFVPCRHSTCVDTKDSAGSYRPWSSDATYLTRSVCRIHGPMRPFLIGEFAQFGRVHVAPWHDRQHRRRTLVEEGFSRQEREPCSTRTAASLCNRPRSVGGVGQAFTCVPTRDTAPTIWRVL
jgi:hypothetical protein